MTQRVWPAKLSIEDLEELLSSDMSYSMVAFLQVRARLLNEIVLHIAALMKEILLLLCPCIVLQNHAQALIYSNIKKVF